MKFIRALDGTVVNVDQIVSVGPANTIRGSKGFPSYLMATLTDGRTAVPMNGAQPWPADLLDEFLESVAS